MNGPTYFQPITWTPAEPNSPRLPPVGAEVSVEFTDPLRVVLDRGRPHAVMPDGRWVELGVPGVAFSVVSMPDPDIPVGVRIRNADDPDDPRRWWFFPDSTSDRPWLEPWRHADKQGFHMRTRDELPVRIVPDDAPTSPQEDL